MTDGGPTARRSTGLANAEIGAAHSIGTGTVKTHVARILSKLEVRDRVQAVVYAYECGLVEPGREAGPAARP